MSSFCICKSYSHFFSKTDCELDIVLTRTVNILTTNEHVKLTILKQLDPEMLDFYFRVVKKSNYPWPSDFVLYISLFDA